MSASNASLAARIDALEVGVGGTFTQAAFDELKAISLALCPKPDANDAPAVEEPALPPLWPSTKPKPKPLSDGG